MADEKNTNMGVDREESKPCSSRAEPLRGEAPRGAEHRGAMEGESRATAEYCEQLQAWMWQYYSGYVTWQSWMAASAMSYPQYLQSSGGTATASVDLMSPHWYNSPFALPLSPYPPAGASPSGGRAGEAAGGAAAAGQPLQQPQENGNAPRPGEHHWVQMSAGCLNVNL